jgi:hypothetical protein
VAVTWAASTPHLTAQRLANANYGASGSDTAAVVPWADNHRAVITKLTATGTYSTGGDAFTPSSVGLVEVHAAYMLIEAGANRRPSIDSGAAQGTPAFNVADPKAPKIQYFDDGVETAAGGTLTGDVFHVILVGV